MSENAKEILIDWANEEKKWIRSIVREVIETHEILPESSLEKNQHLPEKTKNAVRNKKIFVGMDLASVIASWGYP